MSDDSNWKKLWSAGELAKSKLPDVKQYLKSVGLPMNGEAVKRLQMYLDVKFLDLFILKDGVKTTPYEMKLPDLRTTVAQLGLDPSGDKDELHSLLITHLKKKARAPAESAAAGGGNSSGGDSLGITIAQQILEMPMDYPSILSASGINISADSSVASMRKAYLKLSLLIHPDKLQKSFPDATKAFQALVNAYERLSQPELFLDEEEEEKQAKKKAKAIARSNEGCFRTRIFCPRCKAEWGTPDSGVQLYDYNFLMMGLKLYNCSLCLFDFGCMSAIHKCPHCKKPFDYHPNDYHRKISCSNEKCTKSFGFHLYHVSDRVEKEYRAEIKGRQEKLQKEKEQLEQRLKRAKNRGAGGEMEASGKVKLFLLNLLDECPVCGEEVESKAEEREEHVKDCGKDKKKIGDYQKRLKKEKEEREKKRKLKENEEEVQNMQSWDYLGAKSSEMWLLTEKQVTALCVSYGIETKGLSKDELIAKVVKHRNSLDSKRMITDESTGAGVESSAPSSKRKKTSLSPQDLPSNMESMSVQQLKAFCAANEIPINAQAAKAGIIKEIEKSVYKDEMLRLK